MGTYFHGLFDQPGSKSWFLGLIDPAWSSAGMQEKQSDPYELLADHFAANMDLDALFRIANAQERK